MKKLILSFVVTLSLISGQDSLLNSFDYNDIRQIIVTSNSVKFETPVISCDYNPAKNEFQSLTYHATPRATEYRTKLRLDFPKEYGFAAYIYTEDTVINNGITGFLFACGSEGAVGFTGIGDTAGKVFYSFEDGTNVMNFDETRIYAGMEDGINIIDKSSRTISKYRVFPEIEESSKLFRTDSSIFIINDKTPYIQKYNVINGEFVLLHYKNIFEGLLKEREFKTDFGSVFPFITNIITTDSTTFFALTFMRYKNLGHPVSPKTWFVNIRHETDEISVTGNDFIGATYLLPRGDSLFIVCSQQRHEEGEPPYHDGGIYILPMANLGAYPNLILDKKEIILDLYEMESHLEFLASSDENDYPRSYYPFRKYIWNFDKHELTEIDSSKYIDGVYNRFLDYKKFVNTLNYDNTTAMYFSVLKPKIIKLYTEKVHYEIPGQSRR